MEIAIKKTITDRPNTLDWAKSIGMYCVILGHYVYYFNIPFHADDLDWRIAHFVTLFHMPLFFIISGILYKRKEDFKTDLKNNITSLLIPYILISLIDGIIYYLCFDYENHSIKDIIKYIIGITCGGDLFGKAHLYPAGPIWFQYSLFLIKIMAFWVYKKNNITYIFLLIGLITILINNNCLPFRLDSSFVGFLFFSLGFLCKNKWYQLLNVKIKTNIFLLFAFTGVISLIFYFFESLKIKQGYSININYYGSIPILFVISGILGTCMIISLSKILSQIKLSCIYILSTGLIIPLGFQKLIMVSLYKCIPICQRTIACIFTLLISYFLILLVSKYTPILLGNRQIKLIK